jgi:hypothetical protein
MIRRLTLVAALVAAAACGSDPDDNRPDWSVCLSEATYEVSNGKPFEPSSCRYDELRESAVGWLQITYDSGFHDGLRNGRANGVRF